MREAMKTLHPGDSCEIAFFGGSFTGIDRGLMCALLDAAARCIEDSDGVVGSIRLSTRPDYVDEEILAILHRYPVKTVELGLQSMDDGVLTLCRRGHTAAQASEACLAVKAAGFDLVGQMMIGLPGATPESELATAQKICALGADAVRIYPTVVFCDTELGRMTRAGSYLPLTNEDAVRRSVAVLKVFEEAGIPCIRLGLCASENLADPSRVIGGAAHPALGDLVYGELMFEKISERLAGVDATGRVLEISVPRGQLSRAIGQHRVNAERIGESTHAEKVIFREIDGALSVRVVGPAIHPQKGEADPKCT